MVIVVVVGGGGGGDVVVVVFVVVVGFWKCCSCCHPCCFRCSYYASLYVEVVFVGVIDIVTAHFVGYVVKDIVILAISTVFVLVLADDVFLSCMWLWLLSVAYNNSFQNPES